MKLYTLTDSPSRLSLLLAMLLSCFVLCVLPACGEGVFEADGEDEIVAKESAVEDEYAEEEEFETSAQGLRSRSKRNKLIRRARQFLGVRYRLNACSRKRGMDCSCFTSRAYRAVGFNLPDSPIRQYRYGKYRRNPRRGDLVFFKEGGSRYITHVGIYTGRGKIIHASSYFGRVVEKEMKYLSGYIGARSLL